MVVRQQIILNAQMGQDETDVVKIHIEREFGRKPVPSNLGARYQTSLIENGNLVPQIRFLKTFRSKSTSLLL